MADLNDKLNKSSNLESAKKAGIEPKKMEQSQGDRTESVMLNAIAMAFGTLLSRSLGLVREILFTAFFSRTVTDAWTAAWRLPNLFRRLLGEGSLSVSFIPVFVQIRVDDPKGEESRNLVNSFYSSLLILLSTLTALGVFYPEVFLNLALDENYRTIAGKYDLTVRLAKIMFGFIFLISNYAFFMGILNALGQFALPAFAPTLWNLAMIVSTLLPSNWFPVQGDALAWGVIAGGFLQVGILLPALKRAGYLPKLKWNLRNPSALRVWKNMIPGLLGTGLLQISTIINLRFASSLGEGPISYIYLADRLLELPLSLVSVSLGTALLPMLSELWSTGNKIKMAQTAHQTLRINWYVAVPASLGLFLLAEPLITLLFQRGKFLANDVEVTVQVLKIYSLILITTSAVRVIVPAFYAVKNTWLPAAVSAICLGSHLLLAPLLMKQYGLTGLISSTVFSGALNFGLLCIGFRVFIGPLFFLQLVVQLFKFLLAGLGMGLWIFFIESLGFKTLPLIISLLLAIVPGALVYLFASRLLKIEEYELVMATLLPKVKRKFSQMTAKFK